MKCRSCSQDIDDKAIVCYRCGTPTAGTPGVIGAPRRSRAGALWLLGLGVALAAAVAYLAFGR